jgi:AcrR family transcriptional regulator
VQVGPGSRRQFDRDWALREAVQLLWARGYEGTTLLDLQKAMGGITAPSFYAAFGSKEALFREAVALYAKEQSQSIVRALDESPTARTAIDSMLQAAVAAFSQRGKPRGCLVVLGATNCAAENKSVEEFLRNMRGERNKVIAQRLKRAVAEGDLPATVDLREITAFYVTVVDGLALQARDGASRKLLLATARGAMAAWDALASAAPTDGHADSPTALA